MTAELWNLRSVLKSWAISRTRRWKGSLRISSSVDFWYLLISLRATVPGPDFLAAFVASCFLGALPPVDLRAVCLVRAISYDRIRRVDMKSYFGLGCEKDLIKQ